MLLCALVGLPWVDYVHSPYDRRALSPPLTHMATLHPSVWQVRPRAPWPAEDLRGSSRPAFPCPSPPHHASPPYPPAFLCSSSSSSSSCSSSPSSPKRGPPPPASPSAYLRTLHAGFHASDVTTPSGITHRDAAHVSTRSPLRASALAEDLFASPPFGHTPPPLYASPPPAFSGDGPADPRGKRGGHTAKERQDPRGPRSTRRHRIEGVVFLSQQSVSSGGEEPSPLSSVGGEGRHRLGYKEGHRGSGASVDSTEDKVQVRALGTQSKGEGRVE